SLGRFYPKGWLGSLGVHRDSSIPTASALGSTEVAVPAPRSRQVGGLGRHAADKRLRAYALSPALAVPGSRAEWLVIFVISYMGALAVRKVSRCSTLRQVHAEERVPCRNGLRNRTAGDMQNRAPGKGTWGPGKGDMQNLIRIRFLV